MLYYTADPRDGSLSGDMCGSNCCCAELAMAPGEVNMVTINYAPWSVPIGGQGLVPSFEYTVAVNNAACPTPGVNGAPENTEYRLSVQSGTGPLVVDLTPNELPLAATMTYSIVPLTGPSHGTINPLTFDPNGILEYTPDPSFQGFDYFSYRMTATNGQSIVRNVQIGVLVDPLLPNDARNGPPNLQRMSAVPYIDRTRIVTDQRNHLVQFALAMPVTCRACETYRLDIRQLAQDCNGNTFSHMMCFNIRCKSC